MDVKFVLWARTRVVRWVLLLAWNVLAVRSSEGQEQFTGSRAGLVPKAIMQEKEASGACLALQGLIRMKRERVNVSNVRRVP